MFRSLDRSCERLPNGEAISTAAANLFLHHQQQHQQQQQHQLEIDLYGGEATASPFVSNSSSNNNVSTSCDRKDDQSTSLAGRRRLIK